MFYYYSPACFEGILTILRVITFHFSYSQPCKKQQKRHQLMIQWSCTRTRYKQMLCAFDQSIPAMKHLMYQSTLIPYYIAQVMTEGHSDVKVSMLDWHSKHQGLIPASHDHSFVFHLFEFTLSYFRKMIDNIYKITSLT